MSENNILYDCIIVGAGMAGLAAANALQDQQKNVLILEARERIGGRIDTDTSWGAPVEMGAAWIHGIKANPVFELAKQLQVKLIDADYHRHGRIISGSNQILSEEKSHYYISAYQNIIDRLASFDGERLSAQAVLQQLIKQLPANQLPDLENWVQYILSCREGVALTKVFPIDQQDYIEFSGEHQIFARGYSDLLSQYSKHIMIHFKQQVIDVIQSEKDVLVKTNDRQYQAKQVIITVPLGVLKDKSISFSPPLPTQKQNAINQLGVGMMNKVALHFPSNFWQQQTHSYFMHLLSNHADEVIWLMDVSHYSGRPILLAYYSGEQALQLEGPQQSHFIELIMDRLYKIFPQTAVDPIDVNVSAWNQDRFARGAYMYVPQGQTAALCDELAEPFNRVLFAGEATDRQHYGNVHAALMSGQRAAGSGTKP